MNILLLNLKSRDIFKGCVLMSVGLLRINVFKESVGAPVPDANVKVMKMDENESIVEETITNVSGQSDIIELEAPPVDYSLTPNSPKPYSEYKIQVSREGFDMIEVDGVQVLGDVFAQQNIFMRKNDSGKVEDLVFSIPDHTLYGEYPPKIAEEEVKPLPNATGFVVLDEPVVPEFIVVHDGIPTDSSAPNYWIPYKDYIKNVASNEIYATWPTECIKANILAIISFTLNRVYTEWYRSRGYDFTVTSSTAYDQKFVYQRNIFQEISNIVDDIFSTYITRPNIEQPLFTQYCDGKNVTCPNWLSQWGSKYLADEGYTYIDILRNYYGTNIYLESAQSVLGVPSSFPGQILQVGSTGTPVRVIQEQLNAISNNYPAINKVAVSGTYSQETLDAVKKFQEIFNLPQTGIVDYATWYQISRIYVAVEKLA